MDDITHLIALACKQGACEDSVAASARGLDPARAIND